MRVDRLKHYHNETLLSVVDLMTRQLAIDQQKRDQFLEFYTFLNWKCSCKIPCKAFELARQGPGLMRGGILRNARLGGCHQRG